MKKQINTKYGKMDLYVSNYNSNNRMAISCMQNDDLFDFITINLPDLPLYKTSESYLNSDINSSEFDIIPTLKKLGIIKESYGFKNYNMGTYEYVDFNLDKLKEYATNDKEKSLQETISKNQTIKDLLDKSYFMDRVERLTYRLLLHYAFTLNEDPSKITDKEIQIARDFSNNYFLTHNTLPNDIDNDVKLFINNQIFKATTGLDYYDIKENIRNVINDVSFDSGTFEIYSYDYSGDYLIGKNVTNGNLSSNYFSYNTKSKVFKSVNQKLDVEELQLLDVFQVDKKISI